ncbi:MAG: hypothetical protein WC413_03240 [Candidatus Nanoarchaeia archaeon]
MNKKEIRVILLLYPIFACFLSFLLKANFLVSTLIFFGGPCLIFSFLDKKLIKKAALFSIILTIPVTIIVEYMAEITKTWVVPFSLFPKLFNVIVIEQFLWGFLYSYFIVMYYEYFIEHKFKDKLYSPNLKYLIIISCLAIFLFLIFLIINPIILNVSYFYLKMGIVLVLLPVLLVFLKCPNLYTKISKIIAYFFYFSFIYEITALKLGQWAFPSKQFIGWINIFGINFPFEELFFWMILTAIAILSYYEFFDDDRK